MGLVIIEKMQRYQDYWKKDKIPDPENGKEYDCELWIEDDYLKMTGKHWTGFSRTQTWYPLDSRELENSLAGANSCSLATYSEAATPAVLTIVLQRVLLQPIGRDP